MISPRLAVALSLVATATLHTASPARAAFVIYAPGELAWDWFARAEAHLDDAQLYPDAFAEEDSNIGSATLDALPLGDLSGSEVSPIPGKTYTDLPFLYDDGSGPSDSATFSESWSEAAAAVGATVSVGGPVLTAEAFGDSLAASDLGTARSRAAAAATLTLDFIVAAEPGDGPDFDLDGSGIWSIPAALAGGDAPDRGAFSAALFDLTTGDTLWSVGAGNQSGIFAGIASGIDGRKSLEGPFSLEGLSFAHEYRLILDLLSEVDARSRIVPITDEEGNIAGFDYVSVQEFMNAQLDVSLTVSSTAPPVPAPPAAAALLLALGGLGALARSRRGGVIDGFRAVPGRPDRIGEPPALRGQRQGHCRGGDRQDAGRCREVGESFVGAMVLGVG